VVFLIDLSSRSVEIAGIAAQANRLWMVQVARNLSDDVDGFLMGKRYLIHDHDPLYTAEFLGALAASGGKEREAAATFAESERPRGTFCTDD
jgi:hypothetical protein